MEKFKKGLAEYHEKLRKGLITKATPIDTAKRYPKSFRKAINAKCYDCAGESRNEVKMCLVTDCPLFKLRPWQQSD